MRRLIADIYKISYKFFHIKFLSLSIAVIYIAILNLITIFGLCTLLEGMYPILDYGLIIFNKPLIYGTILAAIALNCLLMIPFEKLDKEKNKPMGMTTILLYTISALILFVYARYSSKFFP